MMDLKRKFESIGSASSTKLLVKNIPKSLTKNDAIDRLKKIIQNPKVSITIPIVTPPDVAAKLEPETTIAFLTCTDIALYPAIKSLVNGKLVSDKKLVVDFYQSKPIAPVAKPVAQSTPVAVVKQEQKEKVDSNNKNNSTSNSNNTTETAAKKEKPVKKQKVNNDDTKPTTTSSNDQSEVKEKVSDQQQQDKSKKPNPSKEKNDKQQQTKDDNNDNSNSSVDNNKQDNKENNNENKKQQQQQQQVKKQENKKKENEKKEQQKQEGEQQIEEIKREPTVRNNRAVVTKITQQLVSYAEVKDFVQLTKSYNYLKKIGAKPDHITYGVMLNACVRCQEYKKAREVFQDALEADNTNEIIYTTFLKALCEINIKEAKEFIDNMLKPEAKIAPNLRTFNAVLRACMRTGDVEIAQVIIEAMKKVNIQPDSTSIEYVMKMYSHHLMIPAAWELLASVFEEMDNQLSPIIFSRLALASLLRGDIKSAVKALSITDNILTKAPQAIQNSVNHKNKGKLSDKNKISSSLFERISRQEINEECDRVRSHLHKLTDAKFKSKITNMESFNRIFFIPHTFEHALARTVPAAMIEDKPIGHSNLLSLFNSYKPDGSNSNSNRQLKMEICSGHGHWVTERAGQDLNADWISLEIRYDRIFQIWSKMILESIDNLYVVGGDAMKSLRKVVPSDILDEVYINYPNPPVWSGADRLIDEKFLKEVNRVLKKDGTLTIVTDDKPYSDQIIQSLTKSKKLAKIFKPVKDNYLINLSEDYGYSYFNKLWNNGQRIKRYCIYITKV
ncbi:hypothetical protein CYY_000989 [Polysphondylium violaceum]|uniref:tRNA (guanine(46)-N(7))-methyltransferase n=1 Tax=Polysphondylium violaceum TaxID=133409 RepID=A0A8J4PYT6_9MYCE|nr:hypothetical protein CYY_000989 [Polysphondylium violaceum]